MLRVFSEFTAKTAKLPINSFAPPYGIFDFVRFAVDPYQPKGENTFALENRL
jgi:hypothetical protein